MVHVSVRACERSKHQVSPDAVLLSSQVVCSITSSEHGILNATGYSMSHNICHKQWRALHLEGEPADAGGRRQLEQVGQHPLHVQR